MTRINAGSYIDGQNRDDSYHDDLHQGIASAMPIVAALNCPFRGLLISEKS